MEDLYAPNLRTLTEVEDFVADSGGVSVLLIGSSVHPQCTQQLDSLKLLCGEDPACSRLGYVDFLEVPAVKERFGVLGVPTTLIFLNGEARCRMVGLQEVESIEHEIATAI